jgi:hypothetical protein
VHNNIGIDSSLDLHIYAMGIAGVILLFMAAVGFGATSGSRVLSLVVGLASLGYGAYLAFVFKGGTYFVPYYLYILPVVTIINAFRSRKPKAAA